MKKRMDYGAMIFDLDGTLVDSIHAADLLYHKSLSRFGWGFCLRSR